MSGHHVPVSEEVYLVLSFSKNQSSYLFCGLVSPVRGVRLLKVPRSVGSSIRSHMRISVHSKNRPKVSSSQCESTGSGIPRGIRRQWWVKMASWMPVRTGRYWPEMQRCWLRCYPLRFSYRLILLQFCWRSLGKVNLATLQELAGIYGVL